MGQHDLPLAPGERHVKAFKRAGFVVRRQNGSHVILEHSVSKCMISIPCHKGKDTSRVLIHKALQACGMSIQDYLDVYK